MFRLPTCVLLLLCTGCVSSGMGPMQSIDIQGHEIRYVSSGVSGPTVVFESGLGDGLDVWQDVYPDVAGFSTVLAYSRPGYSGTDSPLALADSRTAGDAASLLHELLAATAARPPYILVGHSIGGLYALEFARRYPADVAGLVMVDARLPEFTARCRSAGLEPCKPPAEMTLLAPAHVSAELRGIDASEAGAPSAADLGDVSAVLLAATQPPPGGSPELQAVWISVQREFADNLSAGSFRIADGAGHYIHEDEPELVVEAIRDVLARVGESAHSVSTVATESR